MNEQYSTVQELIAATILAGVRANKMPRLILLGPVEYSYFVGDTFHFLKTATAGCNPKALKDAEQGKLHYSGIPVSRMKPDGCAVLT